jgi:hypothetical protein
MAVITMDALVKRINLKLARKGQQLKKPRSQSGRSDLGDYYVLNLRDNFVVARYVKPQTLGRQLGLLAQSDTVKNAEQSTILRTRRRAT